MDFQTMLMQIVNYFNSDYRWTFTVQNISTPQRMQLACAWNWNNPMVANASNVTELQKEFKVIFSIAPNGTYHAQNISNVSMKGLIGDKLGKAKHLIPMGNKGNNQMNGMPFDFDTNRIYQPMEQVLQSYGLTRV